MADERPYVREAEPGEDDQQVSSIEVHFAVPVYIPRAAARSLDNLISSIVKLPQNQIVGAVHWVSGHGSKPNWSLADQRIFGLPGDPDAPASGEPTFDDSVLFIETSARERYESER